MPLSLQLLRSSELGLVPCARAAASLIFLPVKLPTRVLNFPDIVKLPTSVVKLRRCTSELPSSVVNLQNAVFKLRRCTP